MVRRLTIWLAVLMAGMAHGQVPAPQRIRQTFEGIECEFSPGREELARLLAHRFAVHNESVAAARVKKKAAPVPIMPLSPAEMRADRAAYLGGIVRQLGLVKPTLLQEECYDAFLDNYEEDMALYASLRDYLDTFQLIKRLTLWERDDLIHRLAAGDKVAGFSYDPATGKGEANFGLSMNGHDDRFKDLAAKREKLHRDYAMSIAQENGQTVYRGSVRPKAAAPAAPTTAATTGTSPPTGVEKPPEYLPVIIPTELTGMAVPELAEKLWDGRAGDSLTGLLDGIAGFGDKIPSADPNLAYIVLHETTELGIIDRYYRGPDRRWFCDGVANYVPWRVVCDLQGEPAATSVYNLADQLARAAPLREQADLRKWPAVENQSDEDQHSVLNSARYAIAANAVFLMNRHAGNNILPRLFAEIGRTKPDKVSIKTVEKAWKKLTGTPLDTILAEAVLPPAK